MSLYTAIEPEQAEACANGGASVPLWRQEGAEPFVKIENVTKKFGDFTAVDNVSLNIYKNELLCLLGGASSAAPSL